MNLMNCIASCLCLPFFTFHFTTWDLSSFDRLIGQQYVRAFSTCHCFVCYVWSKTMASHSHANTRKMHMDESSPLFPRKSSKQHVTSRSYAADTCMHENSLYPYSLRERPEYVYSEQVSQQHKIAPSSSKQRIESAHFTFLAYCPPTRRTYARCRLRIPTSKPKGLRRKPSLVSSVVW